MARPRNPASPYGVDSKLVSFRVPAWLHAWLQDRSGGAPAEYVRALLLAHVAAEKARERDPERPR